MSAEGLIKLAIRITGGRTKQHARQALWGYIFLSPWLLGLLIFTVGPVLYTLAYSFTEFDGLSTPKYIGLSNYATALYEDRLFWPALGKTLYYSVFVVPLGIVGSLVFALILNQKLPFVNAFRTAAFMPHLTPTVATAVLWLYLLHPRLGPVNLLLGKLGLPQPGWLNSEVWAVPTLIIMNLWSSWGGNRMLIFLAGLQGVPVELTEAAEIDGANAWHRFWHVTLPMISPTMFFNMILSVIGALKVFGTAFVATRGGPAFATWFIALHIYQQSFRYFRMGYGSALAWMFTLVIFALTYFQMGASKRWVYYAGA